MDPGFFSRPPGLLLATLAVAAALLGLGYHSAQQSLEPQLEQARTELAQEASRANQLAAENLRLETRLAQAQALAEAGGSGPRGDNDANEAGGGKSRLVHRGEAVVLLEGRVTVSLESVLTGPRRAGLRVRVLGGKETYSVLAVGQEVRLVLEGRAFYLVVRKILASSAVFTLLPLAG